VVAILAALRERERTGRGQLVKAGLFEAAAFTVGQHLVQHAVTGQPLQPMSVPVRAWGVYDIFRSAEERMIFVGVVTDTQWAKFCEVFARPDLRDDPRLSGNAERVAAREWLVPLVQEMLGAMPTAEVLAKCEAAELAFGPVNRPEDLLDDPHLNAGGGLAATRLPNGAEAKVPRLPIVMDGRSFTVRSDPPEVSGQAREVLREAGLSEAEIAALVAKGAIVA
jgi:crotonobetainyl-CoA:carnitine CoA-transferase CaiB-like acyl-CoA transferase